MSDLTTAAENIRRLAVLSRGMVEAADTLEQLGSVEGALKEGESALAKTRDELRDAEFKLKQTREDIEAARAAADEHIVKAAHDYAAAMDEAVSVTSEMLAKTRTTSETLISDARALVESQVNAANVPVLSAQSRLAELERAIDMALEQKTTAETGAAAAQETLSAVRAEISRLASA